MRLAPPDDLGRDSKSMYQTQARVIQQPPDAAQPQSTDISRSFNLPSQRQPAGDGLWSNKNNALRLAAARAWAALVPSQTRTMAETRPEAAAKRHRSQLHSHGYQYQYQAEKFENHNHIPSPKKNRHKLLALTGPLSEPGGCTGY